MSEVLDLFLYLFFLFAYVPLSTSLYAYYLHIMSIYFFFLFLFSSQHCIVFCFQADHFYYFPSFQNILYNSHHSCDLGCDLFHSLLSFFTFLFYLLYAFYFFIFLAVEVKVKLIGILFTSESLDSLTLWRGVSGVGLSWCVKLKVNHSRWTANGQIQLPEWQVNILVNTS